MHCAFIVSLLCCFIDASTVGTRFQLVFLENLVEAPQDGPLEVYVSNTGSQTASVTVSSPKASCPSETKNVSPSKSIYEIALTHLEVPVILDCH